MRQYEPFVETWAVLCKLNSCHICAWVLELYGDGSLDAGVHVVVRSNKPYDEVHVAQREVQNWYKVLYDGASQIAMNELRRYEGIGLLHDWAVESGQRYDSNGVANRYTK